MKIIDLDIHYLKPYARNARTHNDKQISKIATSIKKFGFNNPILIDKNNTIIAGHAKVMQQVKAMEAAAKRPIKKSLPEDFDHESMEMLTIERRVSKRRGDWQFLPADLKET
jgi:hypothetical protein